MGRILKLDCETILQRGEKGFEEKLVEEKISTVDDSVDKVDSWRAKLS